MYGVSRISTAENVMLIGYKDVDAGFMATTLEALAAAGVVVDMISQTTPLGASISFSFTASYDHFDTVIRTIGSGKEATPLVSGGYSKLNLFGEEMVDSVGVAARALSALAGKGVEIALITTSDLDISLLVRQEDEDISLELLKAAYQL